MKRKEGVAFRLSLCIIRAKSYESVEKELII